MGEIPSIRYLFLFVIPKQTERLIYWLRNILNCVELFLINEIHLEYLRKLLLD